jgi:hypothetical protein
MFTPARRAASSNLVCGGAWTFLPEGRNSTMGMAPQNYAGNGDKQMSEEY